MKLPEVCIRHPVFATVLSLLFVIVGLISLARLDISYFPQFQQPIAYINSTYDGASAEFMSNSITRILEDSISGIDGIKEISSSSNQGTSTITVTFNDEVNYYAAVNQLRNSIAGVQNQLPSGMENPPSVSDNSGANWNSVPTLNIAFTSDHMSINSLNRYLTEVVVPQLNNIEGVGSVPGPYGSSAPVLRVWLNSEKMSRYKISASDVIDSVKNHNLNISSGSIEGPDRSFTVVSDTPLNTPQDFANIIVRMQDQQPLRLKDIAKVEWGETDLYPQPLFINGKKGMALEIRPFTSANPVDVANRVLDRLNIIKTSLPTGVKMQVTYNQALFIQNSIDECFKAILEAIILVSLVVFVFLGSLRLAIIPIITIPVCIIAVFGVMLLFGFTINVMTLLAIVLAIGLVVDDAIVVVENCHRHLQQGKKPLEAALIGSQELIFAIVAMTLTLAIVYIPIGLSTGFTATIFREFAFTLAGSVLISGFIALSLSPMMSAYLLKPSKKKIALISYLNRSLESLSNAYQKALISVLKYRLYTLVIVLALVTTAGFIFANLGQDLIPKEDIGYLETAITLPPNATQNYVNGNMNKLDDILTQSPNIANLMSFYLQSPTNFITLQPWSKRKEGLDPMINDLSYQINQKIPGLSISLTKPDPVDFGFGASSFDIKITTLKSNLAELKQTSDRVLKKLKQYPGLTGLNSSLVYNEQQIALKIDQDQAALLNVDLNEIADSLSVLLGGNHATDIDTPDDNRYPVQVQVDPAYLQNFNLFKHIFVTANQGTQSYAVPLSQLVSWSKQTGQSAIETYNKNHAASITGTIAAGYTPSEVADAVEKIVKQNLAPEQGMAFSGLIQQVQESQSSTFILVALAMVFIYLILSAQFESFLDPLVIMLTVPLSLSGALITLWLSGNTLNVYTNIGMLTLIGLITKHGILIVQFANQLVKDKNYSNYDAILSSAKIRLRPILMTTCAMIFGALPLAIAQGPGSIGRSAIGWVLVGGLTVGTLLSLFIVPTAYLILANYRKIDVLRYVTRNKKCSKQE